jgi:transposase
MFVLCSVVSTKGTAMRRARGTWLPWRPLTDPEYAALAALVPAGRGRPPVDLRRRLDAILWVAASRGPWRELPPALGRANSAHRQLRRWAAAGVLDGWLMAVADHPRRQPALAPIASWLRRAWRRMARRLPPASIALAKGLGRSEAWPAPAIRFPNPSLSETAETLRRMAASPICVASLGLLRSAMRLLVAARRLVRVGRGNRHEWRLR